MMRAVIDRVDTRALTREQIEHFPVDSVEIRRREFAARDARLSGDDDHARAGPIQPCKRGAHTGEQLEIFGTSDVTGIGIKRSVPIEEYGESRETTVIVAGDQAVARSAKKSA